MSISAYLNFQPDWSEPVYVSHVWRTGILAHQVGSEQRAALYTWPRLKMKYSLDLEGSEQRLLQRLLHKHLHQVWGIPVWPDQARLTAQAASGQKVIQLDTTNRHFESQLQVILLGSDPETFEVGDVDVVSDTQITLVDNLASTWPAGTWACPLLAARLESEQAYSLMAMQSGSMVVEAKEVITDDSL